MASGQTEISGAALKDIEASGISEERVTELTRGSDYKPPQCFRFFLSPGASPDHGDETQQPTTPTQNSIFSAALRLKLTGLTLNYP